MILGKNHYLCTVKREQLKPKDNDQAKFKNLFFDGLVSDRRNFYGW